MDKERVIISKDKASSPFFVGVDVGGTEIKIGIVDDIAQTLCFTKISTLVDKGPQDTAQRTSAAIDLAIREAGLDPSDVVRVGLAVPGLTNFAYLNEDWRNISFQDEMAKYCTVPLTFENDANAAAYGEHWAGLGKDKNYNSMMLLTLGTGVGCGIIIDDRLVIGTNKHGGECGHNIVDSSEYARMCNCGHRGHLEAYTSATGVARRTFELLETGIRTSLQSRVQVDGMPDTEKRKLPKMLYEEALNGDEFSIKMIKDTAKWLGIGIVTLMHTIDPNCVLIGGAMTFGGKGDRIGEMFLQWIKDEVNFRAFALLAKNIVIDFAVLGSDAGYLGAAGVARKDFRC